MRFGFYKLVEKNTKNQLPCLKGSDHLFIYSLLGKIQKLLASWYLARPTCTEACAGRWVLLGTGFALRMVEAQLKLNTLSMLMDVKRELLPPLTIVVLWKMGAFKMVVFLTLQSFSTEQ